MPETISNKVTSIDHNPLERFIENFFKAITTLAECQVNNIPVSLILMIATLDDAEKGLAKADHTVYGDDHMHFENVTQLIYQFIEMGTPQHHRALRQLFQLCEAQIIKKEQEQSHE